MRNMVELVEEEVGADRMEGVDLFFLANKSVSEAVYYRGNSNNKEIFQLMLQLIYLELRRFFVLHIIWVAGTRQIAAGIYDFSRGCLTYGIASYGSILNFVPFKYISFERYVSLFPCVWTRVGLNNIEPLNPGFWFKEGRGFKGGKKNENGICMPYHSKGNL